MSVLNIRNTKKGVYEDAAQKDTKHELALATLAARLEVPRDEPVEIETKRSGRLAGDVLRDAVEETLFEAANQGFGSVMITVENEEGRRPTVEVCSPEKNDVLIKTGFATQEQLSSFEDELVKVLMELGMSVYSTLLHIFRCEWISEEQEAALSVGDEGTAYVALLTGVPFNDLFA